MKDVFTSIVTELNDRFTDTVHMKAVKKEHLEAFLKDNIIEHQSVVSVLKSLSDRDMTNWMTTKVRPQLQKCNSKCKDVYDNYRKLLSGKASTAESKCPFSSLAEANTTYAKILQEIYRNIDKLFETESITIYDCRISQLAILGILRQSDTVLTYTCYLFSFMTRVVSGDIGNIPRNRDIFLIDNTEKVANTVNNVLNKMANYSFLTEIDQLRRRQSDLILGVDKSFNFLPYISRHNFSFSILDNLFTALSSLNFFSAAMDAWDDYRIAKYERNKEIREWLSTHVALLKMDLANADPNSPEYVRLQGIINAYDDKIAEYDKAIDDFEKE